MIESHKAAFATSEVTSESLECSYARIIRDEWHYDTAEPTTNVAENHSLLVTRSDVLQAANSC
jgi:hypothetical protein